MRQWENSFLIDKKREIIWKHTKALRRATIVKLVRIYRLNISQVVCIIGFSCWIWLISLSKQCFGYFGEYFFNICALFSRSLYKLHIMSLRKRLGNVIRNFTTFCKITFITCIKLKMRNHVFKLFKYNCSLHTN